MSADLDALQLLLARADDHAPVLPDGLSLTPALAPPRSSSDNAGAEPSYDDVPALPDVWGVIAPAGAEGDRLLEIAAPLIKAREAAMGRRAPIYRVPKPSGPTSISDAVEWRANQYDDGSTLGMDRATAQLILGDFDQVPLAIQQAQSIDAAVGRICFPDDAGYAAYVAKALAAQGAAPRRPGRLVMHTAHDGSRALAMGLDGLSRPGEALLRREIEEGKLAVSEVVTYATPDWPAKDVLLDHAGAPDPGVLFTLSHGLGMPMGGWRSPEAQREGQGAMAFGVEAKLDAEEIAGRRFMPSGLWMMFACFSAGTPDESVFEQWLGQILKQGQRPPDLRRTLAQGAPFVARLPQRALANPEGPLGFIGHVDLAWTHSFHDEDDPQRTYAGRFMRVLAAALAGATFGAAFQLLAGFVRDADQELMGGYARGARGPEDGSAEAIKRALTWMRRQDLAGFILLGDPWARLSIAPRGGSTGAAPPPGPAVASIDSIDAKRAPGALIDTGRGPLAHDAPPIPIDALERAIARVMLGEGPAAVAAEVGMDMLTLVQYVAAYVAAGRRAILG